ncbi:phosphoribosyl-ATP diphosphatase [Beijerinckia indica]|uniref:Phosphoribosyl-ATP pyrophosphatase n=1 Tax=Beijerinckia indica subsp. indica (strain ATCC 9039 / DSM 1715 / NCIMB 8712) TaxID=395963 RepID=B2ICK9_BEII9|nr:phosphoribosyl-ATP diphosphatase [Beijerinckia indica]ACB93898.1 phosphoribosyl-ATP diphosphatase [Beijerinckia indica subsp. indica ATCC 9039]
MKRFTLEDLAAVIADRAKATAESSYTKSLLEGGPPRAAKKLGEEAVEVVIAALGTDRAALTAETADLLYHLLVVLHLRDISLQDVLDELGRRTSRSGHEEKASRAH